METVRCGRCGLEKTQDGFVNCESCRIKMREWVAKGRALAIEKAGPLVCTQCRKNEAVPGSKTCQPCRDYHKAVYQESKAKLASGVCVRCRKKDVETGKKYCAECLELIREKSKKRRTGAAESGMCPECGTRPPADGSKRCEQCRVRARRNSQKPSSKEYHKNRRARLISEGTCIHCAKNKNNGTQLCDDCNIGSIATHAGRRDCFVELKQKLTDQKFVCPISGVRLTVGVNASLDHIVPRARGGSDELDNLQWVDKMTNNMKLDRTTEEFIAHCRLIVAFNAERDDMK